MSRSSRCRTFTAVVALCLLPALSALAAEVMLPQAPTVVDRCGRGALLDINGQRVLLLAGSSYEIGYQQGYLLRDQVKKLTATIQMVARAADNHRHGDFFKGTLEEALRRTRPFTPPRYFEEMRGLADGADVPLEDVLLANIFPEQFHCSGFALFNGATVDGALLHGRILDYMTEVGLQDHAVVTIVKPDGLNNFVTVGYAGFIGSVTGMNDQQIGIGEMGGGGEGDWDGMPMSFLLRKALEEAGTLDEALAIFRDTPRTCEYYYVVSDAKIPDARGLACTPELFEVVLPGRFHERLPHPVADTVLLSAGDRYEHLVKAVSAHHGKIAPDQALDFMNRPIAMEGCLHRVLMAPGDGRLWVANAAAVDTPDYSAAHQPYYRYDCQELLALIPDTAPASAAKIPQPKEAPVKAVAPPRQAPDNITGTVPATLARPLPAADDPHTQQLLRFYDVAPASFDYHMTVTHRLPTCTVYQVSFPSPHQSPIAECNTVYCEYYCQHGNKPRPAVILLEPLDGSMTVSRLIANTLVPSGVDACIVILPGYGPRRPEGVDMRSFGDNPELLIASVRQSVKDARRTARFLAHRPNVDANRIGLCGTSLGGFIAALTAGVDGGFPRVNMVIAGADLVTVLNTNAHEVRRIHQNLEERGIDRRHLATMLESIEPLTFADRIPVGSLQMINAAEDKIVPPECARKLARCTGTDIHWFPTDHVGLVKYVLPSLQLATTHFAGATWN